MNDRLRKYYIFTAIGIAVFIFAALGRELFEGAPPAETFMILSDCCFIPGVLLMGLGGLSWAASFGAYDVFGYAGSTIMSHFNHSGAYRPESFYDYKTRKAKSRKPWLFESLIIGVIFTVLAVIFMVVYLIIA